MKSTYAGCFLFFVCLQGANWISHGSLESIFQEPGLVWVEELEDDRDHTRIQRIDLGSLNIAPVPRTIAMTEKGNHPYTFIDVDFENRTLVAVDKSKKKIMAVSFDDDGFQIHWQLFAGTSNKVNGIAVDWTTDVVYWTDAAYNAIFAVSMAMPNIVETVIEDLDEPYGIATHPMKGYLFWTDAGEHPKIMRSSLGGRNHRVVIEFVDSSIPKAVTVDHTHNRLYWLYENTGGRRQGFGSSDLYGNNPKSIPLTEGGSYFDLNVFQRYAQAKSVMDGRTVGRTKRRLYALPSGSIKINMELGLLRSDMTKHNISFGGFIFLVNQAYKEIHIIPKASEKPELRLSLQGLPFGLVVLDRERQFPRTNPCLYSSCPGVCTRSNTSQDCFCNEELKLTAEPEVVKRQCRHDAFKGILVPKGDGIYSMVQNFAEFSHHTTIKPQRLLESRHAIRAMTSDTRLMRIFYFESVTKIIKSSRLEQGSESKVIFYAAGDVGGITIDGASENLYWTDQQYGHIMVAKADGSYSHKLIDKLSRPKAIAVHPKRMYLYWSDLVEMTLSRCFLDGTECKNIVPVFRYKIYDITIDFKTEKLYWTHRGMISAVFVSDLNGEEIEEIFSRQGSLFTGVAIMHDYIIVSDSSYRYGGLTAIDKVSKSVVGKAAYRGFEYGNWFGVDFHHVSSEPKRRTSACDLRRNPCDQICIPSNTTKRYKCFCSIGYTINETDNTKCEIDTKYGPFVLLADQRYQKLLHINVLSNFVAIPLQQLKQPYALAFDLKTKKIYWSDLDTRTISRADLNGQNQEIIIAESDAYFTSLDIDPENRLLYYVVLKKQGCKSEWDLCGSLVAYNVDESKSVVLIDGKLANPSSLSINSEFGYAFLIDQAQVDQAQVWRIDMNGSNLIRITDWTFRATLVTSVGEYIYFTNEVKSENYYEADHTHVMRSSLDGQNKTRILDLHFGKVTSLAVYRDFIYWTNMSTRGIQRLSLTRPSRGIENVGPAKQLFQPTDIFVSFVELAEESTCSKLSYCSGICLPTPHGTSCAENDRIKSFHIEDGNTTKDFCRIPSIRHGEVIGHRQNLVVPHGFRAYVKCFAMHKISVKFPMRCYRGEWSHIPECVLEYDVCGDETRGYKVYTEPGQYFVYPSATKVDVICIGGGGGGYDAINDVIVEAKKAGDGGNSRFRFGDSKQLVAYGGKGGSLLQGGDGGSGHYPGGDGSASINCTTGGTAGEDERSTNQGAPGISHHVFCGAGGYSDDCKIDFSLHTKRRYAGPGGKDGNGSFAGHYGGGAGSRTGGTGGGGGYSRLSFSLSPKEIVDIEVGKAGTPSYGNAGQGIVVVTWGDLKIDDYVNDFDVVNECVLSRTTESDKNNVTKARLHAKARRRQLGRM